MFEILQGDKVLARGTAPPAATHVGVRMDVVAQVKALRGSVNRGVRTVGTLIQFNNNSWNSLLLSRTYLPMFAVFSADWKFHELFGDWASQGEDKLGNIVIVFLCIAVNC